MATAPSLYGRSFVCPSCHVNSEQQWFDQKRAAQSAISIVTDAYHAYRGLIPDYADDAVHGFRGAIQTLITQQMHKYVPMQISIGVCSHCGLPNIWMNEKLVHPENCLIEQPNPDMSDQIRKLYLEASSILERSPKGSAAMLRLALQLLLKQLGKTGKDINRDIADLVEAGLNPTLQKALDLVRVVGNNAVHPGEIDLSDGREIAVKLFQILNFIANELITKPKELDRLYHELLPEGAKQAITNRDKPKS